MAERRERIRRAVGDEDVRSISRRYFISNGFDGTLTSIGIAVGAFLSGVGSGLTVVQVGVGAAVGLGTSGVWSVWEIERAEKAVEMAKIEQAMLRDLRDTELAATKRTGRFINAAMSGIGPLIGVLVPMIPFAFESGRLTMRTATTLSVLLGIGLLFSFGAYLGSISRQKWYWAGVRMGLAGLVVAGINLLIPG